MKKIILFLLLVSLFGCTKQEFPTLHGEWTLDNIYGGGGSGWASTPINPDYRFTVHFYKDGTLKTSGLAWTELSQCDKYEILDDHTVKFISTTDNFRMEASYSFEEGLTLWYLNSRCGYGEKYVRGY
jgi:hypothetical protein